MPSGGSREKSFKGFACPTKQNSHYIVNTLIEQSPNVSLKFSKASKREGRLLGPRVRKQIVYVSE